ncbi:bifunctional protein-disulfide isomerase/oxidoreductase DsbC [Alteromonas sp. A081]|uniref:bifunctional protein-disulfide isomerase/oxidoreductase DsbC n=1 Tax=Alteromonas sp. A081 TaxID=3410269 RepID=UPI003B982706
MKVVKNIVVNAIAVAVVMISSVTHAAADNEAILQKLNSVLGLDVESISDSPVPGLVQVSTDRGFFYVSENGQFLIQARVLNIDEGMRNETEEAMATLRLQGVEKMEASSITFKAKNEKHVISVFTDITCGYCRKLHNEIDELNDSGITVNYLAFPRSGLDSENYEDMVSVWCAKNPQQALTSAKAGDDVVSASCKNKVAEQYQLGKKLGVNGTPNIILPDGSLIPGYQPASLIIKAIEQAD